MQSVLFKKNLTIKERANAALSSLQQNTYAMSILRSKLESRINAMLNDGRGSYSEGINELNKVLDLVKNSEIMLNDISEKIESARFLEEFIMIINSAAASVSEIKNDVEQLVPMAETALEEMHDTIAKVSLGMPQELRQEIEPAILAEVSAAIAKEKEKNNTISTTVAVSASVEVKASQAPRTTTEEKVEKPEGVPI